MWLVQTRDRAYCRRPRTTLISDCADCGPSSLWKCADRGLRHLQICPTPGRANVKTMHGGWAGCDGWAGWFGWLSDCAGWTAWAGWAGWAGCHRPPQNLQICTVLLFFGSALYCFLHELYCMIDFTRLALDLSQNKTRFCSGGVCIYYLFKGLPAPHFGTWYLRRRARQHVRFMRTCKSFLEGARLFCYLLISCGHVVS